MLYIKVKHFPFIPNLLRTFIMNEFFQKLCLLQLIQSYDLSFLAYWNGGLQWLIFKYWSSFTYLEWIPFLVVYYFNIAIYDLLIFFFNVGLLKWDWGTKVLILKWKSLSRIRLFATPSTIQSMKFSRPDYWSG